METNPLRLVTTEDYPMLEKWWVGHGWPAVPQRILPPLGIIYNNAAAGWLYMDNGGTGVAMMEWLVSNPDAPHLIAARSIMKVVEFLKAEAKRMEYPFIITTCRNEGLVRLLNRAGFQTSDTGMIHLLGVFP